MMLNEEVEDGVTSDAMQRLLDGPEGFERVLRSLANTGVPTKIRVPLKSLMRRDLTSGVVGAGGYLVGRQTMEPRDILRQFNPVFEAGAQVVTGLVGGVDFPIVTTAGAAAWVTAEGVAIGGSDPVFGQVVATPKHAGSRVPYSRQLLLQAPSLGQIVRDQLLGAVADLLGAAAISGTGASGQPTGLLNTAGVGSVSGAGLTHAGVLEMRRRCIAGGARETALSWIGAPTVQETLGSRERAVGGGRFVWDADGVLGRTAHATAACPSGTLVVGPWEEIVVCVWSNSLVVELDPVTNFRSGKIVARILAEVDVVCLAPGAFCVSSSIT